ncbi:MAG: hypothetical protein TECD_01109 [Hyphomicrobiaceae bacterium hypho_1]
MRKIVVISTNAAGISVERGQSLTSLSARKTAIYKLLLKVRRGKVNDYYIAGMCASWIAGQGALPRWMGLAPRMFREMLDFHFNSASRTIFLNSKYLLPERNGDEIIDLRQLLLANRAGRSRSERWIAELICAACMGRDHLWSDLGLMSRLQLSELIHLNFPRLAILNSKNMRWKKFLYKKLCEGEGLYICRAPSCEMCLERPLCFAPDSD